MRQIKITESVTRRSDIVNKYLADVNSFDLIGPEEEAELASRIQNGDEEAFQKLVTANLRFVISVAKQYQNNGIELCDLISVGNLGLMTAARRFDSTRGFKFISYAVWWIRQSIIQAISDQSRVVRLPLNRIAILNRITKEKTAFIQENEREPSDEELAAITGYDYEKIHGMEQQGARHISLDKPFTEDEDNSLLDVLPDSGTKATDSEMISESLRSDIIRSLDVLNERERDIITLSFGIGKQEMTLEEIGDRMNLTRERVRQIKICAIRKLKRPGIRSRLRQYV